MISLSTLRYYRFSNVILRLTNQRLTSVMRKLHSIGIKTCYHQRLLLYSRSVITDSLGKPHAATIPHDQFGFCHSPVYFRVRSRAYPPSLPHTPFHTRTFPHVLMHEY